MDCFAAAASRQDVFSMDVQQVPQGMGSGFVWCVPGTCILNDGFNALLALFLCFKIGMISVQSI